MRTARTSAPASHFLGVRLTAEELALLDRFQQDEKTPNRSEAVRALVRAADRLRASALELPESLRAELEEIVEDGWAQDLSGAVTLALNFGFQELSRLHGERLPSLRRAARDAAERRQGRRRADREGRGLLRR